MNSASRVVVRRCCWHLLQLMLAWSSLVGTAYSATISQHIGGQAPAARLKSSAFVNESFEAPDLAGGYQYGPAGATWAFSGGSGISGTGTAFTSGNPPAPQGSQVAFLQGASAQISQTLRLTAGTYTLNLRAAQRGNYQLGNQILLLQVGGATVGQYQPPDTSYSGYQTQPFVIPSTGDYAISVIGIGSGSDFTAFVDDVRLSDVAATTAFRNSGFETPGIGAAYQYSPSGAAWLFNGDSGITGNANAFTSGNPGAPEGSQVAFLQGASAQVIQTVTMAAGSHTISLSAAQRGNYQLGTQVLRVQVGGITVGEFAPSGTSFVSYQSGVFTTPTTGDYTVSVLGVGSGSDFTAFIDDVRLNDVTTETAFTNGGFEMPVIGNGSYSYGPAAPGWAFVVGSGITSNHSAFTVSNPEAPEGTQVAFLQGAGARMTQSALFSAGTYALSLSAAQRANYQIGTQVLRIELDGTTIGDYQPPSGSYSSYQSPPFTISTTGSHTLAIIGVGSGFDFTAFVDGISVVPFVDGFTLLLSGTISASGAPLPGVHFSASSTPFVCPDSDATGHYFCRVPPGWSGTVTPSLPGYQFTPPERTYSNVTADETQDYLAY